MWDRVFSLALETGLIAALFTGLLIYVLRDTARRERKYHDIIKQLQENLCVVRQIREDVVEIKRNISKGEKDKVNKS